MEKLTQQQVNKKYRSRYIEFRKQYDYSKQIYFYEVVKSYKEIHENTTLGKDVGTELEYRR